MKWKLISYFIASVGFFISVQLEAHQQAWSQLVQANLKFIENPLYQLDRKQLIEGQNPSVIILSCSDSRVPPEIVFQQPLGTMFTVRTAGQVVNDNVLGSIEYAIKQFDVVLLVVMGHENCGAVSAALNGLKSPQTEHFTENHLGSIVRPIQQAIKSANIHLLDPHALEKSTEANAIAIAHQLVQQSSVIAQAVKKGTLTIVPAIYHSRSGRVEKLALSNTL